MKIPGFVLCCAFLTLCSCGSDENDPVDPIVGTWKRNFYQFKNLPGTHKNYENLMLPSHYVPSTTGIYDDKSYELTFNGNHTFNRILVFSSASGYIDKGTWEINGNQLTLDSEESSNDEVYTLHSNSGSTMAFYQWQTWLLLPDGVIDTLDVDYFDANAEMLFDRYADEVELKMYYFFEKPK